MAKDGVESKAVRELRKKALERLAEKRVDACELPPEEAARLIHELEVHQVELEMQNDELLRVQQELLEARDRYAELYDFAPMGCLTISQDGTILEANLTAAKLLQTERAALKDSLFSGFVCEESQDQLYLHSREVLEGASTVNTELELKGGECRRFWAALKSRVIEAEPGQPRQWQTAIIDISKRIEAQRELGRECNLAQQYLDVAGVMIVVLDTQGYVRLINRRGCEILGLSEEEILGKNWFESFVPETEREKVNTVFQQLLRGEIEAAERYENPVANARGEERLIAWYNSVLKDDQGQILGTLGSGDDITELRRSQAREVEARQRLELALYASNVGLWDWDQITNKVYFSSEWKGQIGYGDHEIPNNYQEWESRLHPDDKESVLQALKEHFSGAVPEYSVEFRFRHKDGSYRWIRTQGRVLRDATGQPLRMLGCHVDVTERKRIEAERLEYQEHLRQLAVQITGTEERERKRIAAGLHDNIAQNLALCKMKAGQLQKNLEAESDPALLEEIRTLLGEMISEVRSLILQIAPPELHELGLIAALTGLSHGIKNEYAVRCTLEYNPDLEIKNREDRSFLYQAVRELLINAGKHAAASEVKIKLDAGNQELRLIVEDNGRGFAEQPQKRGSGATSFGLFFLRERLNLLGGTFAIDTKPGRGTKVTIVLPVRE